MIYLITYDLNTPGQDYKSLHNAIKSAGTWWHHLESVWIIDTQDTVEKWVDRLRKHIDKNDELLVVEICDNYNGWLPNKAWEWLNAREYEC